MRLSICWIDLFLEVAHLLDALVLDADEADPHRPGRRPALDEPDRLDPLAVPGQQVGDRLVDQRRVGLVAGRVAADQVLVARLDDLGGLIAAAAGLRQHAQPEEAHQALTKKTPSVHGESLPVECRSRGGRPACPSVKSALPLRLS